MCDCKSLFVPPSLPPSLSSSVLSSCHPPSLCSPSPDGVTLTIDGDSFNRMVGDSLEVVISVNGRPRPSLQFTLNGNTNGTCTLSSTGLNISSIAVEDAGEYVLTATNDINSMSVSFELIVRCEYIVERSDLHYH